MATKSKRTASKTKNESTSEEDDLLMTEEPEVTVSIEDLPGVGPATAESCARPASMSSWPSP